MLGINCNYKYHSSHFLDPIIGWMEISNCYCFRSVKRPCLGTLGHLDTRIHFQISAGSCFMSSFMSLFEYSSLSMQLRMSLDSPVTTSLVRWMSNHLNCSHRGFNLSRSTLITGNRKRYRTLRLLLDGMCDSHGRIAFTLTLLLSTHLYGSKPYLHRNYDVLPPSWV